MKMVKCPQCKKEIEYTTANPFRPFCSDRCKINDLAQWAEESFRVPLLEYDENDLDAIDALSEENESSAQLSQNSSQHNGEDGTYSDNDAENYANNIEFFGELGELSQSKDQSKNKSKQKH